MTSWEELTAKTFSKTLVREGAVLLRCCRKRTKAQKHLSLFVHGYNNDWEDSVQTLTHRPVQPVQQAQQPGRAVLYP